MNHLESVSRSNRPTQVISCLVLNSGQNGIKVVYFKFRLEFSLLGKLLGIFCGGLVVRCVALGVAERGVALLLIGHRSLVRVDLHNDTLRWSGSFIVTWRFITCRRICTSTYASSGQANLAATSDVDRSHLGVDRLFNFAQLAFIQRSLIFSTRPRSLVIEHNRSGTFDCVLIQVGIAEYPRIELDKWQIDARHAVNFGRVTHYNGDDK